MIRYSKGRPEIPGVYACRINEKCFELKDEFFLWYNNTWCYIGSDETYKGEVLGWIGPLQRRFDVS